MRFLHIVWIGFTVFVLSSPVLAKKKIPLQVEITKNDVDLSGRTVYFKLNKPAKSSEIIVTSPEGKVLAEASTAHRSAPAGSSISRAIGTVAPAVPARDDESRAHEHAQVLHDREA